MRLMSSTLPQLALRLQRPPPWPRQNLLGTRRFLKMCPLRQQPPRGSPHHLGHQRLHQKMYQSWRQSCDRQLHAKGKPELAHCAHVA